MNKNELLKSIAEKGYDVGFGAKLHFASFDIIDKVPNLIGFFSIIFGAYGLIFETLSTQFLSATFLILGILGSFISYRNNEKDIYNQKGVELTQLFNQLRDLYRKTKDLNGLESDQENLTIYHQELTSIEEQYYEISMSNQLFFSNWWAHYKFFWEMQIDWINDQKKFSFWRDKIPLSMTLTIMAILVFLIIFFVIKIDVVLSFICSLC